MKITIEKGEDRTVLDADIACIVYGTASSSVDVGRYIGIEEGVPPELLFSKTLEHLQQCEVELFMQALSGILEEGGEK